MSNVSNNNNDNNINNNINDDDPHPLTWPSDLNINLPAELWLDGSRYVSCLHGDAGSGRSLRGRTRSLLPCRRLRLSGRRSPRRRPAGAAAAAGWRRWSWTGPGATAAAAAGEAWTRTRTSWWSRTHWDLITTTATRITTNCRETQQIEAGIIQWYNTNWNPGSNRGNITNRKMFISSLIFTRRKRSNKRPVIQRLHPDMLMENWLEGKTVVGNTDTF